MAIIIFSFLKDRLDDYNDEYRDAQPPFQVRLGFVSSCLWFVAAALNIPELFIAHSLGFAVKRMLISARRVGVMVSALYSRLSGPVFSTGLDCDHSFFPHLSGARDATNESDDRAVSSEAARSAGVLHNNIITFPLAPRIWGEKNNCLQSCTGQGHCVVFLDKTFDSHSASLHQGV